MSFFQLLCIKVVKTGRVPQHIAFIMDGNRRFAKKNSVNTRDGHHKGFDKLSETLKVICYHLLALSDKILICARQCFIKYSYY